MSLFVLFYFHDSVTFTRGYRERRKVLSENDNNDFLPESLKFESILQADVPQGREGKHKQVVTRLLTEVRKLAPGSALKVPLSQLPDSKENIRAALSRGARLSDISIATSSNEEFLYVWRTGEGS
jgi:hypothetical protein